MQALSWILTLIGSVIGGFFLFSSFVEKAAPQQAAAAAIAVGFGVLPYCFARAVSELASLHRREVAERAPAPSPELPAQPTSSPAHRLTTCPRCKQAIRLGPDDRECYFCHAAIPPSEV